MGGGGRGAGGGVSMVGGRVRGWEGLVWRLGRQVTGSESGEVGEGGWGGGGGWRVGEGACGVGGCGGAVGLTEGLGDWERFSGKGMEYRYEGWG